MELWAGDADLERLRRELPNGWHEAWRDEYGVLHARRESIEVKGETVDQVVGRAFVKDTPSWMKRR